MYHSLRLASAVQKWSVTTWSKKCSYLVRRCALADYLTSLAVLVRFMFGIKCSKSYNLASASINNLLAGRVFALVPLVYTFCSAKKNLVGKLRMKYQCLRLTPCALLKNEVFVPEKRRNFALCVIMQIMKRLKNFCPPSPQDWLLPPQKFEASFASGLE